MGTRSAIKILLVDDEPDILEFLKYNLEKENYIIRTASNGIEGIKEAKNFLPHLILLDVMMPEMDGIEACIELRSIPALKQTMIAFLTARTEDYSQIAGLSAGADDYITKPIKPKVLISKIESLLRREGQDVPEVHAVNGIELNRERYLIIYEGKEVKLPRKEFELLALLMSKPSKVFTREEIMEKIWGVDTIVGDRTIDVHIRKIREKLNEEALITIKGIGYKIKS
jgi:two-component system alkaline phosphatase synthesis response regulator PhoP